MNQTSLEVRGMCRAVVPGAEVTHYVLLRVRAAKDPTGPRPALVVVLVLDTSRSMKGEPLAQAIHSVKKISEMLETRDTLGVVAFSAAASTVSPMRRLVETARTQIQAEVASLQTSAHTNISGGLAHAALLMPPRTDDERQVLLLLSDGQPSVGASTPQALGEEVRRIRDRGVSVSTLGYGAHHSDDVMIAIANAGGGRYAFVTDPKLAAGNFARALGAQRDVVLEGVELLLTPAEGCEVRKVFGELRTVFGASGLRVTLPDLTAGDELNVVVELGLRTPTGEGTWRLMDVKLQGRVPVTREPVIKEGFVEAVLGTMAADFDADAVTASALAIADEARIRARALADRRDFAAAAAVLRAARQALVDTPGYVAGSDSPLDDAVEALNDEITNMEKVPNVEEYSKLRKAARDYGNFAQRGSIPVGNVALSKQTPSMLAYQKAMVGTKIPEAWLVVEKGPNVGARYRLGPENDIGRGVTATVRLSDGRMSRVNTRVVFEGHGFWAIDCGSTNGTIVDGRRVDRAPLMQGTTIQVADVVLRFETRP